ncbi:sensor histidine kinase [Nocardioides kribbensis]|uniref:sensor histidine kinase n=1 Tax=Nocardioides kribbensis TaxID=305517 RepID=UPI0032DAAC7A
MSGADGARGPRPRGRRGLPVWPGAAADVGSLRRQLVLWTAVLGAAVALALVGVVHAVVDGASQDAVARVLDDRAATVVAAAEATRAGTVSVPDDLLGPAVALYDDRGRLVGGTVPPAQADTFAELAGSTSERSLTRGESYRALARPFVVEQEAAGPGEGVGPGSGEGSASGAAGAPVTARGVVVVAESLSPYEADEHVALVVAVVAGLIIVGLATLLVSLASRRVLQPVAAMAATAEDWSEHDLDRRFDLGPPTNEIRALGRTLDALLARVADAILAEQRLTSELAHELRTPLTAVLATADLVALRGDLDDIQSACRAMAATVTGLLDLARDRSGPVRAGSGLWEVVTSVCAEVDPDGRVEARVGAGVDLALSHDLAVRALAPVVRNAVELAHHVLVRTERDGDLVRVVVEDDGPGVAPEDADTVFEPGRSGVGSSGLGLALARRVARSAGGDVVLDPVAGDTGGAYVGPRRPARGPLRRHPPGRPPPRLSRCSG